MWQYNQKEFTQTPEEYQGFVYEIRELSTNKKYIGKKTQKQYATTRILHSQSGLLTEKQT